MADVQGAGGQAGKRTSAKSAEGARVVQMLPTWPSVRCDDCRKTYLVNQSPGYIVSVCPWCGGGKFSTQIPTTTTVIPAPGTGASRKDNLGG